MLRRLAGGLLLLLAAGGHTAQGPGFSSLCSQRHPALCLPARALPSKPTSAILWTHSGSGACRAKASALAVLPRGPCLWGRKLNTGCAPCGARSAAACLRSGAGGACGAAGVGAAAGVLSPGCVAGCSAGPLLARSAGGLRAAAAGSGLAAGCQLPVGSDTGRRQCPALLDRGIRLVCRAQHSRACQDRAQSSTWAQQAAELPAVMDCNLSWYAWEDPALKQLT